MCGRYFLDESPELRQYVEAMNRSPLMARSEGIAVDSGEVFPSNIVPAVATNRAGERAVFPMKWGFSIPGGRPLINARAESAAEKPSFREAFAAHRCALPASGYFEWERTLMPSGRKRAGQKYRLKPAGEGVTWLAGLYRVENGFPVFVVLTREASGDVRFIHDRMPVMLPTDKVSEWVHPASCPEKVLASALIRVIFNRTED